MASSGAVYQPTTVTYDDPGLTETGHRLPQSHSQRRWSAAHRGAAAPVSYLARAARGRGRCSTCTPSRRTLATLYCSSGAACAAIGLTLIVHGAIGCDDGESGGCDGVYVTVIVAGAMTLLLSVLLLLLYLRHTRRCCFTFRRKDLGVPTMPITSSTSASANLQPNNPSTDHLLISAQPTASDSHPERAHLMPKGSGDNAVAADDPRILLRPLNAAADVDEGA